MRLAQPRLLVAALFVAIASAPALAIAGYGSGPRGPSYGYYQDEDGFFVRRGLTGGIGFGLGVLSTDSGIFECFDCSFQPAALGLNGHIGGMLDHRTALVGEYWLQAQQLDRFGDATGIQHLVMGAIQHWVHPQFWVKGGLGVAALQVSYYDGFVDELASGIAVMGALGYEFIFAPDFAIDIQLRFGSGLYRGVGDRASTALVGAGISWY